MVCLDPILMPSGGAEELLDVPHALTGVAKLCDRQTQLSSNDFKVDEANMAAEARIDHTLINHVGTERSWNIPERKESDGQMK